MKCSRNILWVFPDLHRPIFDSYDNQRLGTRFDGARVVGHLE